MKRSLIVFHAHPDDTEALVGGTLAILAEAGWRLTIVAVTDGSLGGVDMDSRTTARTGPRKPRAPLLPSAAEKVRR
ncbi:MAG: hypothetical protein HC888_13555 [Candidatus Competibacteraceae bacterium]|nr:hypothetical protein [Candidatus Competibacteraceae bacterium]